MSDLISRQAAIDKFIDGLEEIFADIRERHVDDSVCGLCEYDGAYMGVSGDWCNECPGFDKDDCFKLSDKIRKEWTDEIIKSAHPEADEVARDMATIIENEKDMRVIRENAEQRWIPCSKKMPPVHGIFLASIRIESGYTYVATVTHDDKGRPFCFETGPMYPGCYEMIAWRPLPDPYEGE